MQKKVGGLACTCLNNLPNYQLGDKKKIFAAFFLLAIALTISQQHQTHFRVFNLSLGGASFG
jgi:hypothetical protein